MNVAEISIAPPSAAFEKGKLGEKQLLNGAESFSSYQEENT